LIKIAQEHGPSQRQESPGVEALARIRALSFGEPIVGRRTWLGEVKLRHRSARPTGRPSNWRTPGRYRQGCFSACPRLRTRWSSTSTTWKRRPTYVYP